MNVASMGVVNNFYKLFFLSNGTRLAGGLK